MNTFPFTFSGPQKNAKRFSLRAFTLIEILTTMAILAVLIALVAPNVSKGIGSAKTAQCASNLRQIGVGLMNYAGDNAGQLPQGSTWDKDIGVYFDVPMNAAGQFTGTLKVFQCPADPKPNREFQRSYTASRMQDSESDMRGVFGRKAEQASRKIGSLKYPSKTIMIAEKFEKQNLQFKGDFAQTDGWLVGEGGPQTHFDNDPKKPYYHRTGANYLFCDGHVELLKLGEVLQGPGITGWTGGRWVIGPKE